MNGAMLSDRVAYETPSRLWQWYQSDPARFVVIVLSTFVLGYGARLDNGSPFTLKIFDPIVGNAFTPIEIIIIFIVFLEGIRRLLLNQLWVERSPITWGVILLGLTTCVYPTLRMFITEGGIRFTYEMVHLPMMLIMFFIWLVLYRREELPAMLWMVFAAGLFKGVEGAAVFARWGLGWGLLTGWRDGMLLTLMIVGALFAFAIKPEGDIVYGRMRKFLFAALPLSTLSFMGSLRRSYMLAVVVTLVLLAFYMRRQERRALRRILPLVLVMAAISMATVGWGEFVSRMSAISAPSTEGSTAYRVFEFYNVTRMILEHPIVGWPMGTEIRNYTLLNIPPISTLIPHNIYLYTLWRGGVFGLLSYLLFLVMLSRMHIRTLRAAETPFERFSAFLLATSAALVIFTGFTTPVAGDRMQIFYPFLLVMAGFLPGAWPRRRLDRMRGKRP